MHKIGWRQGSRVTTQSTEFGSNWNRKAVNGQNFFIALWKLTVKMAAKIAVIVCKGECDQQCEHKTKLLKIILFYYAK